MSRQPKKRVGRPPKDPSERVVRVFAYVPPDVMEKLEKFRERDGDTTVAAWVARHLTRLARQGAEPS